MLNSKKITITLYALFWLILPSLLSTSLYAFCYKISYTNASGERDSFYLKTNAVVENQEIGLSSDWLQWHSCFSSSGSFSVMTVPRYTVEQVEEAETLGHFVFYFQGGTDLRSIYSTHLSNRLADAQEEGCLKGLKGKKRQAMLLELARSEELSRSVLPALQMIERELTRSYGTVNKTFTSSEINDAAYCTVWSEVAHFSSEMGADTPVRGTQPSFYVPYNRPSSEYQAISRLLHNNNLISLYRNFHPGTQNRHSPQYFLISSVLMNPGGGEHYQEYLDQRSRAIERDILAIRNYMNTSGFSLELRLINIENEAERVRVNFMLVGYISDDNQATGNVLLAEELDSLTSYQTSIRRYSPVSLSVQYHGNALTVPSAPLSQYFPPDSDDDAVARSEIPLVEESGNDDWVMIDEYCNCPPGSENRSASE